MKFKSVSEVALDAITKPQSMFVIVEYCGSWSVVYHKHAKVMYAVGHDSGTFTMLANADGTPMLWGGCADE